METTGSMFVSQSTLNKHLQRPGGWDGGWGGGCGALMEQHLHGPFLEMNIGVDGGSPSISCLSGPVCLFGYSGNGSLHLAARCLRTPPPPTPYPLFPPSFSVIPLTASPLPPLLLSFFPFTLLSPAFLPPRAAGGHARSPSLRAHLLFWLAKVMECKLVGCLLTR